MGPYYRLERSLSMSNLSKSKVKALGVRDCEQVGFVSLRRAASHIRLSLDFSPVAYKQLTAGPHAAVGRYGLDFI